ncbi:CRC domain-containing protein, partial [Haematococcus lacustris]
MVGGKRLLGVNAVGGGLLTELCPMPPLGLLTQLTPGPVKSCHCKKSQCLKLYCDCFAAGVCLNSQEHAERVEEKRRCIMLRDPEAFTRKIMADSQAGSERHKRGCNCKRSHCLKKYCECFQ